MKIVIAPDKFKGSLSAEKVTGVLASHLAQIPDAEIVRRPMADGGEGTTEALIASLGGVWKSCNVTGPLPHMEVEAGFGWIEARRMAVIEMAAAAGLVLLPESERNPLQTTTRGVGQLLLAAARQGASEILLGVGGSATVDGGVGAAQALGWQFLDRKGQPLVAGGGALRELRTILPAASAMVLPPVRVLCDVDNPLLGSQGAARVFGPQKGATDEMVAQLEAGLERLARCCREQLGIEIADLPGGGAAGGLAAGARAFFGAKLTSGIDTVMELCGLEADMQGAAWAVTGEGRFDEQSLRGKVVAGVARLAKQSGARVVVVAGQSALAEEAWRASGVDLVLETRRPGQTVSEAMAQAEELLGRAGERLRDAIGGSI